MAVTTAGEVSQYVETSELVGSRIDEPAHLVFVGEVGADEFRLTALCPDDADCLIGLFIATSGQHNLGSLLGEQNGGGPAHVGAGTGDQSHFSFESHRFSIPCWLGSCDST